jgi:hypothetical protein
VRANGCAKLVLDALKTIYKLLMDRERNFVEHVSAFFSEVDWIGWMAAAEEAPCSFIG